MIVNLDTQQYKCKNCQIGKYKNGVSACAQCDSNCPGSICLKSSNECLICPDSKFLDLETFNCENYQIFVDSNSKEYLEFGTKEFPYKDLGSAITEVNNIFSDKDDENMQQKLLEILLPSNRTTLLRTQNKINIIDSLSLTIRKLFLELKWVGKKSFSRGTRKNLNDRKIYYFGNKVKCYISEYHHLNQTVNQLNILQSDIFDIYGSVFKTYNPLNFEMINSIIQTEYIKQAVEIVTDCSLTQNYANYGDITFQNFSLEGEKFLSTSEPMIIINSINNITFDDCKFKTYTRIGDPNLHTLVINSVDNCLVKDPNDTRFRNLQFTNIFISTPGIIKENIVSLFYITINRGGDLIRPIRDTFENLTAVDVTTHTDFIKIGSFLDVLTLKSFYFKNVNLATQQTFGVNATLNGIIYIKMDKLQNAQTMIKHSTVPLNAYTEFINVHFHDNILFQNSAFQMDRSFSQIPEFKQQNALFQENFSNSRGSVIFGDFKNTLALISNSNFTSNYAYEGGIFYLWYGSQLNFTNCTFQKNYALKGGVGSVLNQGQFNFFNSTLTNNNAIKSALISIEDSSDSTSTFSFCIISSNLAQTPSQFIARETLDPEYNANLVRKFLKTNVNSASTSIGNIIDLRKAKLQILNNTIISDHNNLISLYLSDLAITHSMIREITISEKDSQFIQSTSSIIRIEDSILQNFKYTASNQLKSQNIFQTALNSQLFLNNVQFERICVSILQMSYSKFVTNNFTLKDSQIETPGSVFQIDSSEVKINNTIFQETQIISGNIFEIKRSTPVEFQNSQFLEIDRTLIFISNSDLSLRNTTITGSQSTQLNLDVRAIHSEESIIKINQSNFQNLSSQTYGGVIFMYQGTLRVTNSTFENNIADIGGVFSLQCSYLQYCSYDIKNSQFHGNQANTQGAVVYYNKYRPLNIENNTFQNNSAPYGNQVASYPFSVKITQISLNNTISEYDLQSTSIIGLKEIKVQNGIANFSDLTFVAKPGSQFVPFQLFSPTINLNYIQNIFNITKDKMLNQKIFLLNFRECEIGEITQNNQRKRSQYKVRILEIHQHFNNNTLMLDQRRMCWRGDQLHFSRFKQFMQIWMWRAKTNNDTSVILKIMTNFLQVITTTSSLKLDWPVPLVKFYNIFSQVGMSFLMIRRQYKKETLKRWVIISAIIITYFLHPQITKFIIGIFFCIKLDNNEYWLQSDLQVRCWTDDHVKFCLIIGLPFMILWVIGLPLGTFIHLYMNRRNLEVEEFSSKYRVIYRGLKRENYYWEFINILRKIYIVAINVILQTQISIFKAMIILLVLVIQLRLQQRIQPYKSSIINELEKRELQATIVTFYAALFFVHNEIEDNIKTVVFGVIIAAIAYFIILWIYCFLQFSNYKFLNKLGKFIRFMTFLPSNTQQIHDYKIFVKKDDYEDAANQLQNLQTVLGLNFKRKLNQLKYKSRSKSGEENKENSGRQSSDKKLNKFGSIQIEDASDIKLEVDSNMVSIYNDLERKASSRTFKINNNIDQIEEIKKQQFFVRKGRTLLINYDNESFSNMTDDHIDQTDSQSSANRMLSSRNLATKREAYKRKQQKSDQKNQTTNNSFQMVSPNKKLQSDQHLMKFSKFRIPKNNFFNQQNQ
eukprot:403362285